MLLYWKHIFPFGNMAIAFEGDYLSQYLPFYYGVWDMLHGYTSSEFSWQISLGMGLAGGMSHFYARNPFLLLLILVKREQIPYMMTLVYGLVSLTMAIGFDLFLSKSHLIKEKDGKVSIRILCAIAYTFSLHSIMYMGMGWPITGMLVPFLMIFLEQILFDEDRLISYLDYILILGLVFITNIPQAYAVCLFLIFYVTFISLSSEVKTIRIRNFIWCSLLALGCSMVYFLPAVVSTTDSYRFHMLEDGKGFLQSYHRKIAAEGLEAFRKAQMLQWIGPLMVISLVLLGVMVKKNQASLKKSLFLLIFEIMIALPLIAEVVNIMWNNGPYVCFPVRHAYLIYFTVLSVLYIGLTECDSLLMRSVFALILAIGFALYTRHYAAKYISTTSVANNLVQYDNQRESFHRTRLEGKDSAEGVLSFPMGLEMVGNYYPLNTTEQIEMNQALGYNQVYVRLSDLGGTVLSDMLLHIDSVKLPGGDLVEQPYQLPQAIYISAKNWDLANETDNGDLFKSHNQISRMIFGEDLIENCSVEVAKQFANDSRYYLYLKQESGVIQRVSVDEIGNLADDVILGVLDTEELEKDLNLLNKESVLNRYSSEINIDANVPESGFILVSAYDARGWEYQVNDSACQSRDSFLHLMILPVQSGKNQITATWSQPGKRIGLIVTTISIIVFIVLATCKCFMKELFLPIGLYKHIMNSAGILIWAYIYLIPLSYRVLRWMRGLI